MSASGPTRKSAGSWTKRPRSSGSAADPILARARRQVILSALVGFALIVVVTAGAASLAVAESIGHADDARLTTTVQGICDRLDISGNLTLGGSGGNVTPPAPSEGDDRSFSPGEISLPAPTPPGRAAGIIVIIRDASGAPVGTSANGSSLDQIDPSALAAARSGSIVLRDAGSTLGGVPIEIRSAIEAVIPVGQSRPIGYVEAALPRGDASGELQSVLLAILVSGLIAFLIGAAITMFVSRRALRPIRAAFDRERRLLADASHEMRTPVTIIGVAAEMLEREGAVAPSGVALLEDLRAESRRLSRLVTDVLSLARLEQLDLSGSAQAIEIEPLLRDLARRADLLVGDTQKTVRASGSPGLWARVDPDRLIGAISALIENALRFTSAGGEVLLTGTRDGDEIVIRVDDAGPGIPLPERETVFRPFARLEAGRESEGNGLGLPLARAAAIAAGGSLQALAAPTGGARLELRLPAAEKPATT